MDYNNIEEINKISSKSIKQILDADYNKASLFSEEEKKKISKKVIETYDADKHSRQERETKWKNILDLIKENGKKPLEESDAFYPLIRKACKKYAAEAYPLLVQDGNIVKAKAVGKDDGEKIKNPVTGQDLLNPDTQQPVYNIDPGDKIMKAQRRVEFENFLLLNKIDNYEKSFDELLYRLPMLGTFFKKVYFCQSEKKIKIDTLFPQNVIVNQKTSDNKYTVYSQELYLDYNEIKSNQNSGIFLDIPLTPILEDSVEVDQSERKTETSFADEKECPQLFIEQHRWLDLDNDGFLEPYIVIIHKDSEQLLGLYARYTKDDITRENKKITDIKAREYFIKYEFFPSCDGDYYSDGLGDLLFNSSNVIDSILNQLIDAGALANRSQGFVSKALKKRAGDLHLDIGEWKFIDTFGVNVRDMIFPIDHKEPSMTLFSLLQFLLQGSKELAGAQISVGDDLNRNIAPGTMMALVQEGAKEFKSVYKRIYRSLKKEINLIEQIIRDNVDNTFSEMYIEVLDDDKANFEEDFNNKNYDVIPVADVDMVTSFEKNARLSFMMNFIQLQPVVPFLTMQQIVRDILTAVNYPNINDVIQTPPPPAPDPAAQAMQAQMQIELEKIKTERMRIEIAVQETKRKAAEGAVKARESDYKAAEMEAKIEEIITRSMKNYADTQKTISETALAETQSIVDNIRQKVEALYEPKEETISEPAPAPTEPVPEQQPAPEQGMPAGGETGQPIV